MKNIFPDWFRIGALLGLLNALAATASVSHRLIGASTGYPYLAGKLAGLSDSVYMKEISTAGSWELFFVLGAFIGTLLSTVPFGKFKFQILPKLWQTMKGNSKSKRIAWAFAGGFILITGARLAGGCTSGHIFSGGMQLAAGSLVFAFCVILSFFVMSRIFYGGTK
jgi:uncharacterized membrane protein YedE/YeeE